MGWYDLGGTVRAARPEETLQRVRPLFDHFGITRVASITGLDHIGIPVAVAVRPGSRLLSTSQGKGVTRALAEVSAVMESIETWHAENMPAPTVVGSFATVSARGPAVDPGDLKRPPYFRSRLGADDELAWMSVRELMSDTRWLLPAAYLDMDTTEAAPGLAARAFRVTTTGLASGNTQVEAALHGLYEVVERDAHFRWNQLLDPDEQQARQLDLETVTHPHNRALLDQLAQAGMHVDVTDMSSDIQLPVFRATLVEADASSRYFVDEGAGAHLSPDIALARALTEAVQSRLSYISGSRDDLYPSTYRYELRRLQLATEHLQMPTGTRSFDTCWRPALAPSFQENLTEVLSLLRRGGVGRVFVFDHTRPVLEIPVVHVICPELSDVVGLA